MLKVDQITFSYDQILFKDLSFQLNPSERLVIVGASGEGKSTLAKIIAGHITPDNGRVFLSENDMTGKPNKKVILVDQEDDLFPWLRVEQQLSSFCKDSHLVDELLELVELHENKSMYPCELSGGMKKRLSIARALSLQPNLIIFDESFSALDHQLRQRLLDRFEQYLKFTPIISIFISHNLEVLKGFVDRSLKISDHLPI